MRSHVAPALESIRSARVMKSPFATLALAALAACGPSANSAPPPQAPPVTVAAAIGRQVTEFKEFTGRLEAVNAVEIRPRVSGYVTRVAFKEGAEVHTGDLLFIIDPRPYRAELARAEAQLEQARTRRTLAAADLARAQKLVEVQAISREEFDSRTSSQGAADAEVQAAQAAVETAKLNLAWTEVRSPISGRVSRAEVTVGNLAQAGPPNATLLTTVVSLDPMYLYFDTDEQTYLRLVGNEQVHRGAHVAAPEVLMGLIDETGYPHRGTIDFVDNRVDPTSGTIRLRAKFQNPDRQFTPGLFARVRLASSDRYAATLVNDAAIGTDQDRKFVLVLGPGDTAQYRRVELGPIVDGLRVIQRGLAPGEKIVINGLQRVRPGSKVAPTVAAMTSDTTAGDAPAPQ